MEWIDAYEAVMAHQKKLAVIGLGYVGLPIAVAFSKKVEVIGFDTNEQKIEAYRNGIDGTGDLTSGELESSTLEFTTDVNRLENVGIFIVAVPTPIKEGKIPDLGYLIQASRTVGQKLAKGAVVIYESTVYPGVTEEICIPILEEESGLRGGLDFKIGYSPERINPGDKKHQLTNIVKIVSGIDADTLELVARLYNLIIEAGVYRAESIKVAEAAKVIENAQRDINIAFMNELSMLFHQMDIDFQAVLKAARSKWNFLPFTPGLVGGHCIGIDPYYLNYKAEDVGYRSKLILASRHINEGMGKYIVESLIKNLIRTKHYIKNIKIAVLGLTYKENCTDIRNTKVLDIIRELEEYGLYPLVVDPYANQEQVYVEYGIELTPMTELKDLNVVIVATPHDPFVELSVTDYQQLFSPSEHRIMMDVKGIYARTDFEKNGFYYWSL